MAELKKITSFLKDEFAFYKGDDDSCNGLQVEGESEVKKIAYAVDACAEVFEKAARQKADLVLVHHGLFWKGKLPQKMSGAWKKRLAFLLKDDISLVAYHLPLDAHPKIGNNALLAEMLGLQKTEPFGEYHGAPIALRGNVKPQTISELEKTLENRLGVKAKAYSFGPKIIKRLGVCSGGGAFAAYCEEPGIDCLVTGELKHGDYQQAKDAGVSVIKAGHYATETLGVAALAALLKKKFGVETVFIDVPTGL